MSAYEDEKLSTRRFLRKMTSSSRTDVHDYWVPLYAIDSSSDGPTTVPAIVYGTDGGTRNIGLIPLVVDAGGAVRYVTYAHPEFSNPGEFDFLFDCNRKIDWSHMRF